MSCVCICMCDCMVHVCCVCLPKGAEATGHSLLLLCFLLYSLEKIRLEILLLFSHHSTGTAKLRSAGDLNSDPHV